MSTHDALKEVEAWNAGHPIGTPVLAFPGAREDAPLKTRTRSKAWVLGGHTPVVKVDGHSGGIALTHVEDAEGGGRDAKPLSPEFEAEVRARSGSGVLPAIQALDLYSTSIVSPGCVLEQDLYPIAVGLRRQIAITSEDVSALLAEIDRLRALVARLQQRDITSPLATIAKHGDMSETARQEIYGLLAEAGDR
ncbi:hypothetical protein ACFY97_18395 [Streptomyces klenkii]|uniref:hypothetical protein n=1 Tax=Streptomyces klenkii TaxID=1420899 RepID=UPI0036E8BE14